MQVDAAVTAQDSTGGPQVGPSTDPAHPVAVLLVRGGPTTNITREHAWLLLYVLQAELVRTVPFPPTVVRQGTR